MANFDFKGLAKVLGIAAGTGVAAAGAYGLSKEAWNSYMNGRYGDAALCAMGAGSAACLTGLGVKAYTNITLPTVLTMDQTTVDAFNKVADAAKGVGVNL